MQPRIRTGRRAASLTGEAAVLIAPLLLAQVAPPPKGALEAVAPTAGSGSLYEDDSPLCREGMRTIVGVLAVVVARARERVFRPGAGRRRAERCSQHCGEALAERR